MDKIDRFVGKHEFLSNFYPSVVEMFDGQIYPTAEHAFQAHKTHDLGLRYDISQMSTANAAKKAGRRLVLRDDWEDIKLSIMEGILFKKFTQNLDLRESLLATDGAELIEGNTWGDKFWGVCEGKGYNHLGMLLMKLRATLLTASSR